MLSGAFCPPEVIMRRFLVLSVCALTAALVWLAPVRAQATRPTVAVLNFDFGSIEHWWSGNQDIGQGISDLIVDGLVDDGSFRVIERKKLDSIISEQNLSNSERADPSAKTMAS